MLALCKKHFFGHFLEFSPKNLPEQLLFSYQSFRALSPLKKR